MERWGCAIFAIGAVLFASQRFILFNLLLPASELENTAAAQAHRFLFGHPPYSIVDVLLGFEVPDEGLLFLLQPHNLLLGFTQALHTGLNLLVVYGAAWLLATILARTSRRPWLRFGGCAAAAALLLVLSLAAVTCVGSLSAGSDPAPTQIVSYQSTEYGIRFGYPDFLAVSSDSSADRGPSGELITMQSISATSSNPVVGIVISSIEDPLRDVLFPELYPIPRDDVFKTMAASEITSLDYPRTDANRAALDDAIESAVITSVGGFPAVSYTASLEGTAMGHVHVRGALVITPRRDISLYVIGSDEGGVPGSVTTQAIDDLWETLVSTIRIEY
jgi:hypothetical protein